MTGPHNIYDHVFRVVAYYFGRFYAHVCDRRFSRDLYAVGLRIQCGCAYAVLRRLSSQTAPSRQLKALGQPIELLLRIPIQDEAAAEMSSALDDCNTFASLSGRSASTPRVRLWSALKELGATTLRDGVALPPASDIHRAASGSIARRAPG